MRELVILIAHLLATLAKLAKPGGVGAVAAESLAVKHQLLILKRTQRRAPMLTASDRLGARSLCPFRCAETAAQAGRDPAVFNLAELSSRIGAVQVSAAL
jgi:hypothetical protein